MRVEWYWGNAEDKAFSEIKHLAIQAALLVYYHANKKIAIQCDASSLGLGTFLMQEVQSLDDAIRALTVPKTPNATIFSVSHLSFVKGVMSILVILVLYKVKCNLSLSNL